MEETFIDQSYLDLFKVNDELLKFFDLPSSKLVRAEDRNYYFEYQFNGTFDPRKVLGIIGDFGFTVSFSTFCTVIRIYEKSINF